MPATTKQRKKVIHVNQHKIRHNGKTGDRLPVITVKDYKQNEYGHEASIIHDGVEVARVVYRPDKPLSCGAKVWIETRCDVKVEVHAESELETVATL